MQLHNQNRQNLINSSSMHHDDDNLECRETLSLPLAHHSENRVKTCGCRCTCLREQHQEDALQKRRQKRKQSKRRQKERQKQLKEKALLSLQTIIRNIYALKTTFKDSQIEIENCLAVENHRDRLCEFINMVIRQQIDLIRKEIVQALASIDQLPEGEQHRAITGVFFPIRKIVIASPQVEKLINLFVASYSQEDEEQAPMQRNLDRTTLKFLVKTDLYRTGNFNRLCSHIFQAAPEQYQIQRELINMMMSSFDNLNDPNHSPQPDSSQSEQEDAEEYMDYDEQEWEEEASTIESPKNSANERSRRRRKERRRKLREDFESTFQAVIKRTEQISVVQQERVACNVSEEWVQRILRRKQCYQLSKR